MHHDQQKYEESKLITLLAGDSEYAFQLLYDRYRNRIYQVSIRYLKSPLQAQEVVQDIFLKLWIGRQMIKKDQPIEAWLYTVARNNILNRLKKVANEWKLLQELKQREGVSVNATADKLQDSEYNQLLKKAIEGMSEQQKIVFDLSRNENMTYAQIADKMHISPLTVKTHMSRALEHIRAYFTLHGEMFFVISLPFACFF